MYTIRDFLYWTLSVRGIHANFFKSGLVEVLVGRSFISYCGVYHLEFWVIHPYVIYNGVSP